MTWPFENDTSAITKKIAKNDIDKNRVKKGFSLTTIVFATALLMMLIMFESGYETTKDRMAEGQPQVVFYDLSQQQIELLYSEENIESIKVTETENGYDASITIVDATKMTQYGFSSAVDNISSKYDIHHVTRNDLFMDSLPNGGLLNLHYNCECFSNLQCFLFICCKSSAAIWAASYCRNDTAANKENHPLRKKNFM